MMYVSIEDAIKIGNEILDKAFNDFIENYYNSKDFLHAKNDYFPLIKPYVVWKKKGYRVAGTAYSYNNKIEMNINYLNSPDALKFIRNTMLHELAHIINSYYGGRCHDKQWKYIARLLGDDGERCHDYKEPENKPVKRVYELKCTECGKVYKVSAYRYNRYMNYRCKCDKDSKLKQM